MSNSMTNQPSDFGDLLEWEPPSDESLELFPEQVDRAIQISQPVPNLLQQWQTYLNALALLGVKEWLAEWAPDLTVNDTHCSIYHPPLASLINGVCNLEVGQFKLCLITTGNIADTSIEIPKAAIDLPQFIPHIYVLVEVKEEQMQTQIYGYLRHDQQVKYQQSTVLEDNEWSYSLPLDWFTAEASALLLELRCLDATAISLPTDAPAVALQFPEGVIPSSTNLSETLLAALPQLQSPLSVLHQVLSWEEISTILTTPELTDWVYQAQQPITTIESSETSLDFSETLLELSAIDLRERLAAIFNRFQTLGQQAINVGLWLHDQLDGLAQELSWTLMPALSPATAALRSVEDLETVVAELHHQAIAVPTEARGAYRDLRWGNVALRLYALIWNLPALDGTAEWALLLVLGSQSEVAMPAGVKLQIRDSWKMLVERNVSETTPDSYLYAQVVGEVNEQFWVTIDLSNGIVVTFAFAFYPDGLLSP